MLEKIDNFVFPPSQNQISQNRCESSRVHLALVWGELFISNFIRSQNQNRARELMYQKERPITLDKRRKKSTRCLMLNGTTHDSKQTNQSEKYRMYRSEGKQQLRYIDVHIFYIQSTINVCYRRVYKFVFFFLVL